MENNGITNGYAWYEANGGRQDYMNYFRYCREATIELSDTKILPESQLLAHWDYNYRSFLNYIEESGYGLRGLVTDSMSGEPLNAKIFISNFDKDSSQVYTDPQIGDYHRLLKGGMYTVTYSAAGYFPKTVSVQVTDKQTKIQDIQLYDGRLQTNFKADSTAIAVDQTIHFTDQSAGNPLTWSWTFEGGSPSTSTEQNPIINYQQPGNYTVKLVVTRSGSTDSLVRSQYIEVKPWYFMGNKTYTLCDARFFDAGGPNAQYTDNENSVITFYPEISTKKLTAIINNLDIEDGGTECINDRLMVYDGTSTTDNLVATLCGTNIPDHIIASNAAGALTFQFLSNSTVSGSGWDITLSCDSNVGISEKFKNNIKIYPNPASNGKMLIETENSMQNVVVRDVTGRIISSSAPLTNRYMLECNWPSGIYLVQIEMNNKWVGRKIQIIR
jgi:PKD repeat protein